MLYIITELERHDNPWTRDIISHTEREFSKRRLDFAEVFDAATALKKCDPRGDAVLIPTPATSLILPVVEMCNEKGIPVIVPNALSGIGEPIRFNCVRGDIFGAVSKLFSGFERAGRKNVALYGVNSNSQDDLLLSEAFSLHASANGGIYFNDGDTGKCFSDFSKDADKIDAVICANDYIAVDLIERMHKVDRDWYEKIVLASFSNTLISAFYNKPFTSLAPDLENVASATSDIYNIVKKDRAKGYNSIVVYVDYEICERGNGVGLFRDIDAKSSEYVTGFAQSFDFSRAYDKDAEISDLLKIESALSKLTSQQLTVLAHILSGSKNSEMCSKLYLSDEAVRYHIKKVCTVFDCSNKVEVRKQLSRILNAENIFSGMKRE